MPNPQHYLVRDEKDALVAGSELHWLACLCQPCSPRLSLRPLIALVLFRGSLRDDEIDHSGLFLVAWKTARRREDELLSF